jgi:hypothetical protein
LLSISEEHPVTFLTRDLGEIACIERRRVSPFIQTLKALHGGVPIPPVDGWAGIQ